MTFVLGLTGSIGMGKTTTAQMFAQRGVPVWDADACVHDLYAAGGKASKLIAKRYPDVIENGSVSREKLRNRISENPDVLDQIQKIVHPLVAEDRAAFLKNTNAPVVLLDIPLLYETGTDALCDAVAVVSVDEATQRNRVLERGKMSEADLDLILSRQMPDAEKRNRARWVIPTLTLDGAEAAVTNILAEIEKDASDA